MSALKAPTDCVLYARALHAYVDGELSVDHTAELEAHVVKCGECFEQVEQLRATRLSLRRAATQKAPEDFRAKMTALVAAQAARPTSSADRDGASAHGDAGRAAASDGRTPPYREAKLIPLRHAMALAAAAGVVLTIGIARNRPQTGEAMEGAARGSSSVASLASLDDVIDDLVDMHASPLPPETTNPEELKAFDPFVGVPVRRPAMPTLQPLGARWDGARLHAIRGHRAALLLYTVQGGHRVTMYVFDPQTVPLQRTHLEPRVVQKQPVYVGNVRGYSFAATERSGVGYALATDLDNDTSARLVASVQ